MLFAYVGFNLFINKVGSEFEKKKLYDQVAKLENEYYGLKNEYESLKVNLVQDENLKKRCIDVELQLVRAKSAIDDVKSALESNKDISEIKDRLENAKSQVQIAKEKINQLKSSH